MLAFKIVRCCYPNCVKSNLTGIRGIAALWVWSLHYNEYFTGLLPITSKLDFITQRGNYGVDLFFCLSGFILGHVYYENLSHHPSRGNINQFFYKRMARLYPVYVSTLLVATLFYLLAIFFEHEFDHESASNLSIKSFFQNLLGVQAWFGTASLNGPSWSVSAEFGAYLFFPFIVVFIGKIKKQKVATVLLVVSIAIYELSLHQQLLINHQMVQVLCEFTMGLCCYLQFRSLDYSLIVCRILRLTLLIMLFSLLYFVRSDIILSSVLPLLLMGLITLNFPHNVEGKGLSRSIPITLGIWSYSLYMTHRLLQNVMSGISLPVYDSSLAIRILQSFLLVCAPIYIAHFVTKHLENPARRYVLNKSK